MTKPNKGVSKLTEKMKQLSAVDPDCQAMQQLRKIGQAFVRGIELGIQECACLLLRQRFIYTSRTVVFINTSPPENRSMRLKSLHDIEQMDDNEKKHLHVKSAI